MSAPPANETCPLTAATLPLSSVAPSNTLDVKNLKALVSQALQLYRSSNTWPSSKTFQLDHDSKVVATKGKSVQPGRLANTSWHARRSEHDPSSQSHKLTYEDFYQGLAVDHPIKERQYIDDILKYDRVGPSIQVPSLKGDASDEFIDAVRADVWTTEYSLPIMVTNRDFVELFLTVEFKPHVDPLSSSHIDAILASLKEGSGSNITEEQEETSTSNSQRRSCLNIQLPVETTDCAPKKDFVRASYGSVEVLRELERNGTEWWMTVQSDSAGRIPLMFQEMAMADKVAPDVPLFIGWAVKDKQSSKDSSTT
ncbi:hypothetical protein CBS101457_003512 [Exobasidium rhododendri]|nr:hypothetical protein CBS101457_003512 [Exobasidium rhododendri]